MPKIRFKNVQTAQGMVEFALVLPILLMIILGVFAFGHMFFAYSSVVSASREASRWAAAVGATAGGHPRYNDCDEIMNTAVRIGSFAGVAARDSLLPEEPGIEISYDHGPADPPEDPYGYCRQGAVGPDVGLGDRVIVRVTVMYQPIVPLVNMPTFPLTATTARTVIKDLSVGEAPAAEAACYHTTINISFDYAGTVLERPYNSLAGQPLDMHVVVVSPKGNVLTGEVNIVASEGLTFTFRDPPAGDASVQFMLAGEKTFRADFAPDPDSDICYLPSTVNVTLSTIKADTSVVIEAANPEPSIAGNKKWNEVIVRATVSVSAPGSGTPTGTIRITDQTSNTCLMTVSSTGTGYSAAGTCTMLWPKVGDGYYYLVASYEGDANYNKSTSPSYTHQVIGEPTATPSPTVTETPTRTPTRTPTLTPTPMCPGNGGIDFVSVQNGLKITINNLNGVSADITGVDVSWPNPQTNPGSPWLNQICTTTDKNTNSCSGATSPIWHDATGVSTAPISLPSSSYPNWNTPNHTIGTKANENPLYMLLVFNGATYPGDYHVTVYLSNHCGSVTFTGKKP